MNKKIYTIGRKHWVLLLKVPQEILSEIKTSVDEIQNDFTKATPITNYLAGQIDKEYQTKLTTKQPSILNIS
jgi:hypothetical protein